MSGIHEIVVVETTKQGAGAELGVRDTKSSMVTLDFIVRYRGVRAPSKTHNVYYHPL